MLRYITQKATVSYYKSKQFQSSEGKVSLYPRIKKLDPTYMPQDLRKVHNELDKIVDVLLVPQSLALIMTSVWKFSSNPIFA